MSTILVLRAAPTPPTYTLSLHDALPILRLEFCMTSSSRWCCASSDCRNSASRCARISVFRLDDDSASRRACSIACWTTRSEEHTSELQSRRDLVCRLLLEKKKE